jgi:hypothetical protein
METYVIRIGTRPEGEASAGQRELRGTVEHVSSGRREPFRDAHELLAFFRIERRGKPEEVDR